MLTDDVIRPALVSMYKSHRDDAQHPFGMVMAGYAYHERVDAIRYMLSCGLIDYHHQGADVETSTYRITKHGIMWLASETAGVIFNSITYNKNGDSHGLRQVYIEHFLSPIEMSERETGAFMRFMKKQQRRPHSAHPVPACHRRLFVRLELVQPTREDGHYRGTAKGKAFYFYNRGLVR